MGKVIATTDPHLVDRLSATLARLPDVVVLQRINRAAGRRDWFLMTELDDLNEIFDRGEPQDAFTFFLRSELQIRGRVGESLIRQLRLALNGIQENREELLLARVIPNRALLESEGFSRHEEMDLVAWLNERVGEPVIAGPHPPLFSTDPRVQVTAVVPDQEGKVTPGVY
jgi:hypothetical protein